MAGSVLRSKMRSLRQGKAEESKGEDKPRFFLSFCSVHKRLRKYEIGNRVRCAPYTMRTYLAHVLFGSFGFAKMPFKQSTGLFSLIRLAASRQSTFPSERGRLLVRCSRISSSCFSGATGSSCHPAWSPGAPGTILCQARRTRSHRPRRGSGCRSFRRSAYQSPTPARRRRS